jgi:hypothetical protein
MIIRPVVCRLAGDACPPPELRVCVRLLVLCELFMSAPSVPKAKNHCRGLDHRSLRRLCVATARLLQGFSRPLGEGILRRLGLVLRRPDLRTTYLDPCWHPSSQRRSLSDVYLGSFSSRAGDRAALGSQKPHQTGAKESAPGPSTVPAP